MRGQVEEFLQFVEIERGYSKHTIAAYGSDLDQFNAVFGNAAPGVFPFVLADHADFNGDGTVDLSDFSIFRALFGNAPGPSGLNP